MLLQLSVKNLAVVEHLDLSFESGMSAVTGETGAGKSIVLQALSLALGVRGDSNLVRHGKDRADIGAVFLVEDNQNVQTYLKTQSLADAGECVLRRVISADGRSKSFINGISVPLSVLRSTGDLLIDMHGQNEHQLLLRPDQQLLLLDNYAQLDAEKTQLNSLVATYKALSAKVENLRNNQSVILQQQALYTHQINELDAAQLDQDELDHIEANFKIQANAQELIEQTAAVLGQLEGEAGVNAQLLSRGNELAKALAMDDKLSTSYELLNSAQVQTQEAIYELTNYLSTLSIDEEAANLLADRIAELHELGRKHQCPIVDLLHTKTKIEQQLAQISGGIDTVDEMLVEIANLESQYQHQAKKLSKIRAEKSPELAKSISAAMQVLGMRGGAFTIGLPTKEKGVHYNGLEAVEFLVKTNMGQDFKALKKVASGGELSRISLALSVVSSDSEYPPTLIFDEVDVGISGAVAEVVGRRLRELSKRYQVICITHLAQVASFADQHLRVQKTQNASGAQTTVEVLSAQDRVDEIARILSGAKLTEKTRKAAAEMIEFSR